MAECELLSGCIFFNDRMASMPATADLMKSNYCLGDPAKCARRMVFEKLGRPHVPPDLFPSQTLRARMLLESE